MFLLAIAALTLVGCTDENNNSGNDDGGGGTVVVDDTKVTGVDISQKSLSVLETSSSQLTATVHPNTAINKTVSWSSSNPMTVSVDENGKITALNEGTATITVKTEDGGFTSTCTVTVTKKQDDREVKEAKLDFNALGYTNDQVDITTPFTFGGEYEAEFTANEGTSPKIYKYNKKYAARAYAKNTLTITSETTNIVKIVFAFDPKKDNDNSISVNCGTFLENTWVGESKCIVFTIGGDSGYRGINDITVSYVGEPEDDPNVPLNLGTKTIEEVRDYIAANPISGNAFGNWVNEKRYVTIEGVAVARIDTVKEKAAYGLDLTYAAKVILADETGYIACASKTGQGNLWYKVGDNVCKENSKYSVCGYLSYIQGKPELKVISYEYNTSLDVTYNPAELSKGDVDINGFYDEAVNVNYNCAGHGYGEVVTLKNVYCYQHESDGTGKRYYWFTDGTRQMRVNAFNMPSVSDGGNYDITGIISLKNYSPIIVAWDIKSNAGAPAFEFDYESAAVNITAADLNKLCPPQEDTTQKQPYTIRAFASFYKVVGYYIEVANYNAISDVEHSNYSNLPDAISKNNVIIFSNDNLYGDYEVDEGAQPSYFALGQFHSANGKSIWEGILLNAFLETLIPKK